MCKKFITLIIILFVFVITGCSIINRSPGTGSSTTEQNASATREPEHQTVPEPTPTLDPIWVQIAGMSLSEKVGQLMMVGLDGYVMNDVAKKMIENYHVGGFIIMGDNVQNANQLITLMNEIKKVNTKNKFPLFLSVDEEGGRVTRMPGELKRFPANRAIGQINNPDFSFKIGSLIAEEIGSFGFNMDFAPVLDIDSNPKNPVIGDRSFSAKPETVSTLGVQTMKGLQSGNVIPVVKHFPGHGDTIIDSHVGLPSLNHDRNRLWSFELIPFAEAIKNSADAVMIAHILIPNIDPTYPASLSKTIITNILRKELNFSGVVITDDMTMGAIQKNYSITDAAIQSIQAGSDIILVCHGDENRVAVINQMRHAVETGRISETRINESVYRILKLKQKYKLNNEPKSSPDIQSINKKITQLLN